MSLSPDALRVEYFTNPVGLDVSRPRLSWKLRSDQRNQVQAAWQVIVASSAGSRQADRGDVWDSGQVKGDQSMWIPYAGRALASGQRVHWKVRVWDRDGNASDWSEPAYWEMGLLDRSEWRGEWIGAALAGGPKTTSPCPFLRKGFTLDKPIASARLYATALGVYEFHLNGQVVGQHIFAPGWTDYRTRVQYQTYDVTSLLKQGENVAGAILGDGWYCGYVGMDPRQRYGDRPKLLAQIVVRLTDGTTQTIATDGTWTTSFGPLLESDMLMGESYDARREMPGWDTSSFDASKWAPASVFDDPGIAIVAQQGPPVRRIMEIKPIDGPRTFRKSWDRDGWIYDMGQNMVGRVRLKVKGPAGTTVAIRHAEILDEKKLLYTTNLRAARATDYYTLKGDPNGEIYEPRFTFHGFRYVEIDHPGGSAPSADAVTGIVLHSNTPFVGEFECSDPLVNQLQHNIQWGQRGNFLEVPTDCPQRDERLGWTGDAQVFIRTAAFNAMVDGFFAKWMQDVTDAQAPNGAIPPVIPNPADHFGADGGPAWADAAIICPWTIYLCYGDARVLEKHYETFKRFVSFLKDVNSDANLIRVPEDYNGFRGYGDWLAQDGSGADRFGRTPNDLIGTAFFSHVSRLLSRIATVLGKHDDAERYRRLADDVKAAFVRRFITPDGLIVGQTQTCCVLALHFDLAPADKREAIARQLVSDIKKRGWKLSTGFVGSPYLNHVLTATGNTDVAFKLLHQTDWPSWLYAVTQGATTIWERWDAWTHDKGFADPGMNSFNHYAYGAIGEWLYSKVAGIDVDPDRPGYKHIVLRPHVGGKLTSARAAIDTVHGRVSSAWRVEDGTFHWAIEVPPNTTATVHVPTSDAQSVRERGTALSRVKEITNVRDEPGRVVFDIGSGTYTFAAKA